MPTPPSLVDVLLRACQEQPGRLAVEDARGRLTYAELDDLTRRGAEALRRLGVGHGDRVGVAMRKSVDAYVAVMSALRVGAAYVPVDYSAPGDRIRFILEDCAVKVAFLDGTAAASVGEGWAPLGGSRLEVDATQGGNGIRAWLSGAPLPAAPLPVPGADDVAYVLYTSGSTGKPKGVTLTHRCAVAFVAWVARTWEFSAADRFSSHAPFHFDLSILDLYVPMWVGASVVLIGPEEGKEPLGLARLIAERGITVWYSTPTILTMLAQYGRMEGQDYSALRLVFFAGEVFPIKHLRHLRSLVPHPRYVNLYGPTETNVCTYLELPSGPDERATPYPIGRVCEHLEGRVVDLDGTDVSPGEEGELVIAGDNVMVGYWNLPERTAQAFLEDAAGRRWYRTGDLVVDEGGGTYTYVGRRDRMVKRRGYRIELGEIEVGMLKHPAITGCAAIAVTHPEHGVRIHAVLVVAEGRLPITECKAFAARVLPSYMVPDVFRFVDALPRTSTDKVDYQALAGVA